MRAAGYGTRLLAQRQNAQTFVEFGLVLPLFLGLMMVAVQVSLLLLAQLSVAWFTHNMVRYMATGTPERWRFNQNCAFITTYRNSILPPILQPANLTITYTPSYTPSTSSCTNPAVNNPQPQNASPPRIRGGGITVNTQYAPNNLRFLPATFFGIPVLSTLPPYEASAVME